jgi:hypothetical protein
MRIWERSCIYITSVTIIIRRGYKQEGCNSVMNFIMPSLRVCSEMRMSSMKNLHKRPNLSLKSVIISSFPDVPKDK